MQVPGGRQPLNYPANVGYLQEEQEYLGFKHHKKTTLQDTIHAIVRIMHLE